MSEYNVDVNGADETVDVTLSEQINVNGGGGSNEIWLPDVDESGNISWSRSSTTTAPTTRNIKGADGQNGQDGQDGADGLGVKSVDINASNHFIVTYDDDTTHDAGEIDVTVPIDDTTPAPNKVYSSEKVESEITPIGLCFEDATRPIESVFVNDSDTSVGVTYSIEDDIYSFNGTASSTFAIWSKLIPAGTYTLTTDSISGNGALTVGKATFVGGSVSFLWNLPANSAKTFTLDADSYLRFALYKNSSVTNLSFRMWYNAGDTAIPYVDKGLALKESALPESVKELIENMPVFMSVADFNTADADMMNSNAIAILY